MNKKLAIIGSRRMAWIISRNAHEMGILTYCFSNIEPDYIHEEVDEFHNISIFEKDRILKICKDIGIDGVIATTELTISIAAYLANRLGLPGMQFEIAKKITDKFRNRLLCSDIKEFTPVKFCQINDSDKIYPEDYAFPIIVKPTNKGGKKGVTVVTKKEDLLSAVNYARENSSGAPIIVEEYIMDGKEYSVEALSFKGKHYIIQITEKISSGPPHCVELGHLQPADISGSLKNKITIAVSKGLSAIGVDNTSSHTEIKVIGEDIYIIEFNVRPGGDHIAWPLTELSTGYNMIKGAIDIALGSFDKVDYSAFRNYHAGVYFVTEQTKWLKPIFDRCDECDWLYHKNKASKELKALEYNDCYETNSMIYFSKDHRIKL